jgi:hypothetical protein
MRNYQIAQETDAQKWGTAEGCVKGLLESSTPIHTMRGKQASTPPSLRGKHRFNRLVRRCVGVEKVTRFTM